MWEFSGRKRPPFAEMPGPGRESVWDYPRPPKLAADKRRVVVRFGEVIIAETSECYRVLETASPPTFYIPPADVEIALLQPLAGASVCEWKGQAAYWGLRPPIPSREAVGWSYPAPQSGFKPITNYFSFYPGRVECFVDGERVRAQPGRFYGGWVTSELVGPWKGEPGSESW